MDVRKKLLKKRYIIFGTGSASKEISRKLKTENIIYYVDNNSGKWNQRFLGKSIKSPEDIRNEDRNNVFVIVASIHYIEIAEQLTGMGLTEGEHFINSVEQLNKNSVVKKFFQISQFFKRIHNAIQYYNPKYYQIIKWGFTSREDTNYTYDLTDDNIIYLAHTIAFVSQKSYHEVYDLIHEAKNDKDLKEYIIEKVRKSNFRDVADLRADFGRRLGWYAFVRLLQPKVVIETGVDKGLGAILLCSALLRNKQEGFEGKYYGTDIDQNAGYLLSGKYKEVGKILYGDSIESLKSLDCKIDLFINDSDHSEDYEYREYQTIKDKLSFNGIILGDNCHVTNKLAIFSLENNRRFLFFREMPKDHWYPGCGIGISY